MTLTRARTIQYIGILLSLGLIAAGYWYFSVRAGVKTNTSASQPQGNGRLDSGLVGYWKLDDGSGTTAADSSVNSNNGTLTNGPTWTAGQIGSAVDFDGTNDYISAGDISSLNFYDGDNFTITGWFNRDTATTADVIVSKRNGTGVGETGFMVDIQSTDELVFRASDGSDEFRMYSKTLFTSTGWHHFAVVFNDSSTTNTTLYIDGHQDLDFTSGTLADVGSINFTDGFNIGAATVTPDPFDGKIDEIRVYDRVLSPDEVGQLYRLTSPTSVDTSLKGYWSFNAQDMSGTTTYDRSGAGNNGTLTGGATGAVGRVGQAVNLDGTNDYVVIPNSSSLQMSSSVSFSFWLRPGTLGGESYDTLVSKWDNYYTDIQTGTGIIEFGVDASASPLSSKTAVVTGNWYFVSAVFDDTGNTMSLYINGVLDNSQAATGTMTPTTDNLMIGSWDTTTEFFTGQIDEVRVYNRALSAAQIKSQYDLGAPDKGNTSTSQTEGTGRLSSGLVGYWPLDNGSGTTATDASVNGNNGTLNNGPLWTTGQIGGAVDFDGTDDYIQKTDTAILDFGDTDNFTLAGWFNRDTATTDDVILAKRTSIVAASAGYIVYLDATTDQLVFEVSDGTDEYSLTSTTTFTSTGWHHFSIVWDQDSPANSEIYIDGAANNATDSGTIGNIGDLSNSVSFGIGVNSLANNPFDGKIDEVRLYDRVLSPDEISRLYQLTIPTAIDTSLRAYWSFDGQGLEGTTLYDLSGGRGTGTLTNGPTKAVGRVGQGLDFDGTNDHVVQVTNSSTLAGISQATVAFWLFPRTSAGYDGGMFATIGADGGGNGPFTSGFEITGDISGGTRTVRLAVAGSVDAMVVRSSGVLPRNAWTHVVVVWDGTLTAANTKFYFDGSPVSSVTLQAGSGTVGTTAGNFNIGSFNGGTTTFDGKIDELRVYNRQLSAAEIKSLYDLSAPDKFNTSVSQPQGNGRVESGLSGYWKLDENTGTSASDSSPAGNTGTFTNGPVWSTGQIGSGVTFDGVNDYIDVGDVTVLDGAKAMTAAAWVKTTSSNEDHFLDKSFCDGGTGGGPFELYAQGGEARFVVYGAGGVPAAYDGISSGQLINDNAWHYVAGTYDGLYIRIYVDGVESGAVSFVNATLPSNSYSLSIGGHCSGNFGGCGGDCYWPGQVDEARIYNRALSGSEINNLYRTTAPNGVDSSLKGYWSFNGQDVSGTTAFDRSGAGNTGTLTNGTAKGIGKLGQALSFDGTDDYVAIGDVSATDGLTALTVSAWAKSPSLSSERTIVAKGACSGVADGGPFSLGAGDTPGTAEFVIYPSGGTPDNFYKALATSTMDDGNWHLVTGTYDGAAVRIYMDGILSGTTTAVAGDLASTGYSLDIGWCSGAGTHYWNNGIDEVRVYNRALTSAEILSLYNQSK